MTKHVPNIVSTIGGLLGLSIPWFALQDQPITAVAVFAAAILCDILDGGLARLLKAESQLGKDWVDPINDGVKSAGAMIGLIFQDQASPVWWWMGIGMLIIGVAMKTLKHQYRFERLRFHCTRYLPYCYIWAMAVLLNFYAEDAFNWGWAGIPITVMGLGILWEIKKGRRLAWAAGLR